MLQELAGWEGGWFFFTFAMNGSMSQHLHASLLFLELLRKVEMCNPSFALLQWSVGRVVMPKKLVLHQHQHLAGKIVVRL